MNAAERLIQKFNLKPHPEGGYYSQGYRSPEFLKAEFLPGRYQGVRNLYSSIYFMVTAQSASRFHKLKTDEIWHFYTGDALVLHLINEQGKYQFFELSNTMEKERFQMLVKKNTWMAASTKGDFSLVGCTLSPGFEYVDFELGVRAKMLEEFPNLEEVIMRFTAE
jgi:predicted cupin superfamily sugar epimerase